MIIMLFDFDAIIPRKNTGCIKFDRRPELDPYWVADMDFAVAPCITQSIIDRAKHPIYGYAQAHSGLIDVTLAYLENRHSVRVKSDSIVWLGGLVPALSLAVRAFCKPGDEVLICTPSYPPFLNTHHDADHVKLITIPHVMIDGKWTFNFPAMEASVTPQTKIFLLSNPQNPLGRVFTRDELIKLADFCIQHHLILVSDEIHCDLTFDESATPHICAHRLPEKYHGNIITLLSPSKTYNIAGIGIGFALITCDSLRRRFCAARGHSLAEISTFGYYAAEAAYRDGESWRQKMLAYLRNNQELLHGFLREKAPQLIANKNEATYLTWIDCRAMNVENPAIYFEKKAKLFLSDGAFFGMSGFVRFNFACPQSFMMEGLEKMIAVIP
jgi:cysteine-S-conjugate beta-lyase